MAYVDGFVAAVPTANRQAYIAHAAEAAKLFTEFGATRIVECWGDDVPDGKVTDFRRAVQAEEGETIVFAWIEYPSKDVRNEAMRRMMEDHGEHGNAVRRQADDLRRLRQGPR